MINWITVESNAIRKVGYSEAKNELYVDMGQRQPYCVFSEVSKYAFFHFAAAESVEDHFESHIKSVYSQVS
ncbi:MULTISPECIES: KTSC domain-containing protein [unclassified Photobacterium]|uniref:KTSC domain-containing protein n=1 Tax=unclassified Photobacterium TaxID=2628852 RepID=UPI000D15AE48|nr:MULTISPECIES: KTSC domain-containing protein [unclassified Photobacterium]PSV27164.1 KTSC domain-containing protein [Photobacterium sp. GB-56]PSV30706.1 KTSC domain-containing protein [Photobacterium sp. GB-72]PSV34934.1 KTSC domain-containing protein [Photobacterium sp. GB-27]PSV35468.1 KTSC domain-containing protein [Photobacterium sp. GB-210]PSV43029.1 KTSC domain-containing protein [Photobacterium sp. GB-36]